jgi:PKD repeat protein
MFMWDLGDGTVGDTGTVVTHTYELSGIFTVVLTVTNPCDQVVITESIMVTPVGAEQRIYLPILVRH